MPYTPDRDRPLPPLPVGPPVPWMLLLLWLAAGAVIGGGVVAALNVFHVLG